MRRLPRKTVTVLAAVGVAMSPAAAVTDVAQAAPTQAPTLAPTAQRHLARAQADWIQGDQPSPAVRTASWRAARAELVRSGPGYAAPARKLATLLAVSGAGATVHRGRAATLTRDLDAFFDTPGRYGVSTDVDPLATARPDWIASRQAPPRQRAFYLDAALRALSHDVHRYGQQATQLAELAALPTMHQTAAQRATAARLTASLDAFFAV